MPLDFRLPARCGRACLFCIVAAFLSLVPLHARAQDDAATKTEEHGRKYKAPPDTSQVEVTVLKDFNQKPIMNAAVVFNPVKDGVDEGNLEVKTDPDGKAMIDVIPTGSKVTIQVIADGFATFAQDYQVNEPSRKIVIRLIRPRAQVSAYIDNSGRPSQMQPGMQVPIRPKPATAASPTATPQSSNASGTARSSTAPSPSSASSATVSSPAAGPAPQP